MADDRRKDLVQQLAQLRAHRKQAEEVRGHVHNRAQEQLDSGLKAKATAADFARAGRGGILVHRYHRTRMAEDARLRAIVLRGEEADDDS